MTYHQAVEWLFIQLPNYQNQGEKAYKPGLERVLLLSETLGNPHLQFKSIHIAGTNGKGSSAHMLSSILQESGLNVGLFTSPHLKNFTERIKINGNEAKQDFVLEFILKIKENTAFHQASFFEITTLMAFEYFALQKVEIAIIETGLGGRLDATNIISPLLSVITSISLDHTQILGHTLEEISFEKAGIIKENTPIICGEDKTSCINTIQKIAQERNAPYFSTENIFEVYETDLKGNYQLQNQKTVLQTIEILRKTFTISLANLKKGLRNVKQNTHFRGRWEIIQENPTLILDTAHNKAGICAAIEQLSEFKPEKVKIVMGFVNDKDVKSILSILPENYSYYFAKPKNPRGLSPTQYKGNIKHLNYQVFEEVKTAYKTALQDLKPDEILWIGGSNFVISEII